MATTARIRGSNADAMRLIPAPYEAPAAPMCAGSVGVLAIIQSITAETSETSFGPAVSIWPPEPQKPRVVYDTTTYPRRAKPAAWIRYWLSLSPQLLVNRIAGCLPGAVGAM